MKALSFNGVTLTPVTHNNQIHLTSAELSKALGYSSTDKVTNLYHRNADEFSANMTLTLKMGVKGFGNGNSEKEVRIFSLRGCHLIAMFARTAVAKQFRQWVLDILDKEVGVPVITPPNPTTATDRRPLVEAVNKLCRRHKRAHSDIYRMVHQYINGAYGLDVRAIEEIPAHLLGQAIAYVHMLNLACGKKPQDDIISHNIHNLVWHTAYIYQWYKARKEAFYALSPQIASSVHDHIISAKGCANRLHSMLELPFDRDRPRRLVGESYLQ